MIKMDMCWIAAALIIHPHTEPIFLVSGTSIFSKVPDLFQEKITPIMVNRHLVSWEDRQADITHPERGGSRNRYFFKTEDGEKPSNNGDFRLYKQKDAPYDGLEKTGKTYPNRKDIPQEYFYLLDWYESEYFAV